jgi:hypothetical protein
MPVILATQEKMIKRILVQSQSRWIISETLSQKISNHKRTGRMNQVVECLLNKHETLSSKPQYNQKKKKRELKFFLQNMNQICKQERYNDDQFY